MSIQGLDRLQNLLQELMKNLHSPTAALHAIGNTLIDSFITNFEVGGRPPWVPLSPKTLRKKRTKKILVETGRLRDSITYRLPRPNVLEIGTNVVYAAAHQFGLRETITVREHVRRSRGRAVRVRAHQRRANLPARPFIVIQDADLAEIRRLLERFLVEEET